jgi:hypothetical protein
MPTIIKNKIKLPDGYKANTGPTQANIQSPLEVRYIERDDKDWTALVFNITTAIIVFIVLYLLLQKINVRFLQISVPLIAVWILAVWGRDRMWVTVPEQEARVFVDKLFSGPLIVYTQGGHFVRWTSDLQPQTISFQKFEEIRATRANGNTAIQFTSGDGYEILSDTEIYFRYREGKEATSKSLRYRPEELRALTLARVATLESNICGGYDYDDIVAQKHTLGQLVADMFGGEGNLSTFELETGIEIRNPALKGIGLTPESRAIYDTRAKVNAVHDGMAKLLERVDKDGRGLTAEEAARIAQTLAGAATREIYTIEGAPNATTVALGGGTSVAVGGGKSGKGK